MTERPIEQTEMKTPAGQAEAAAVVNTVRQTLEEFNRAASVEAVYGQPVKNGASVVIPAAEIVSLVGFGIGSGGGQSEGGKDQGSGGGGGGGGRVLSRPVAAIILSEQGVRVEPIVDVTKIALAALTAGGFMAGMLMRMKRTIGRGP